MKGILLTFLSTVCFKALYISTDYKDYKRASKNNINVIPYNGIIFHCMFRMSAQAGMIFPKFKAFNRLPDKHLNKNLNLNPCTVGLPD